MCGARSCSGSYSGRGTAAHSNSAVCCVDVLTRKARNASFKPGLTHYSGACFTCLCARIASGQATCALQALGGMCTLLASVLGRVPSQILRSKFNASVQVMQQIVEQSDQQACHACCKNSTDAMQQSTMLLIHLETHCCSMGMTLDANHCKQAFTSA